MVKSAICMLAQVYTYREGTPKPKYVFNRVPVFRTMGTKFVTNDVTLMEVVGGFFNVQCTSIVNKNSGTFL